MKRALLLLTAFTAFLSARAEIEILYLAPNDSSPVLGSISTDSKIYQTAKPVKGSGNWMEIVRKDYYSGFIAKDSLTADGEVEIGTSMLLTPSKTGKVFTTIEKGDEVSVNLVDDWTEITVYKSIPGYFTPSMNKEVPPAGSSAENRQVTYARDPLLAQASRTRYSSSEVSSELERTSRPVAALPTIPTSDPMTGFEEVDSLNPTFGRTSASGQTEGYSLGAGSTPIPRRDTTAPFLDTSMENPTSIAAIPAPSSGDMDPTIEAPTQAESVDALSEDESEKIEGTEDPETLPVEAAAVAEAAAEMKAAETDSEGAREMQNDALDSMDEGTESMVETGEEDGDDSDVIPLAPAAAATGTAAASAKAAAPAGSGGGTPAETIEAAPAVIVEVEEDVEVANDVAESVVPGVTQPIVENEPPLIPPTDTNRIYIGKLKRTSASLFGSKPEYDFELVSYSGDRIAFVDLSEVPMSSYDAFTKQIVQVYGVITPTKDEKTMLIKAANITLR